MAGRIRTLKPEWLENQRLSSCSSDARVLSAGLILLADDYGRGRGSVGYIAGQVWPEHERGRALAAKALEELVSIGYVVLYRVEGQEYFEIPGWGRHQVVRMPGKPRVPPRPESEPEQSCSESPQSLITDHDHDHDPEGDHDHDRPTPGELESLYELYPRKAGKAKGLEKARAKIPTREEYELARAAVETMAMAWKGQDKQFCPHWSTFVNGQRWRDGELPLPATNGARAGPRDRAAELWAKADAIEAEEREREQS